MVKVAILGFGTVGSGVADVLTTNAEEITRSTGSQIGIKDILKRSEFPDCPFKNLMTRDFSVIENDPEVSIVAEVIGGVGAAYDYTKRCIMAGKHVITSNKELVATRGVELMSLAQVKGVKYLFEAAVGGGIPIIRAISQCLSGNKIEGIYGILNGTTNYILAEMINNGISFDQALRQAQELGYAEADPEADVGGADAARKISILASLCYGKSVDPNKVRTEGIRNITLDDIAIASKINCRVKLLGRAMPDEHGGVAACAAPHLVPASRLISGVDGVMNAIAVRGNATGESLFYGPGAGKLPTASAVVADIMDIVSRSGEGKWKAPWVEADEGYVSDFDQVVSQWYIRAEHGADVPDDMEYIGSSGDFDGYITKPADREKAVEMAKALKVKAMYRVLS